MASLVMELGSPWISSRKWASLLLTTQWPSSLLSQFSIFSRLASALAPPEDGFTRASIDNLETLSA